ncbi:MAG: extracellular solute-binding protein [Actinomycetota bacterium]|nr:extracellular solute-binding protein [Actinomycetota bacterium]
MRPLVAPRAAAAVAATVLLASCGGSPTAGSGADKAKSAAENSKSVETFKRINGLSGQARTDELVKCAEEEGELSIYTSNTDIDDLVEEFEDMYDIETSVYRGNSESVLQRVLQEQQARFFGNDILETNALELNVAQKEGFLSPYESKLREKVREEGKAEGWTASRFNTFVVGWNTNLVKPGEEPKSIEELADPKWKGKLSMEVGDVDWFTALHQHFVEQGMSEDEATDLFKKIADNSKIAKGHTVQGELLSAGQFAVAISSYSHTIDKAADKGAPVAWRPKNGEPVQPVVVRPNGIGLMKTASNPCAAMLFVDYELTGGQKVFEENFRVGATPEAAKAIEGLDVVPVPEEELLNNAKKWDDLYAEVTQAGSEQQ